MTHVSLWSLRNLSPASLRATSLGAYAFPSESKKNFLSSLVSVILQGRGIIKNVNTNINTYFFQINKIIFKNFRNYYD